MDNSAEKISKIPTSRKLSREELLAGKCAPDETAPFDPRIKSPDDLLLKMVKGGSTPSVNTHREIALEELESVPEEETLEPEEAVEDKAPEAPAEKPFSIIPLDGRRSQRQSLSNESKENHYREQLEKERVRWKDYEHNVHAWKDRVMEIVQNLNKDAASAHELKAEIERLQKENGDLRTQLEELSENSDEQ